MPQENIKILSAEERSLYLQPLHQRFGIDPKVFEDYHLVRTSQRKLKVMARSFVIPHHPPLVSMGLDFLSINHAVPKLTTSAAAIFGRHASRHVISLSLGQLKSYMNREDLLVEGEDHFTKGYALIRYKHHVPGLGFLEPTDQGYRVISQYPKGRQGWA